MYVLLCTFNSKNIKSIKDYVKKYLEVYIDNNVTCIRSYIFILMKTLSFQLSPYDF